MLKFFFEKNFEIENIKDVLLSTVIKYFIRGYTGEEILSLLKSAKQEKKKKSLRKLILTKVLQNRNS